MCALPIVAIAVAAIWLCAYAASRFNSHDAPRNPDQTADDA